MHEMIDWANGIFGAFPILFLGIWGRFAYVLGLVLAVCAFGGFMLRPNGRWGLGRERVHWDTRALVSVVLTIVLVMGSGYLGSSIVLVEGAQTLESLKDAMVFVCVVLFGYPAFIGAVIAYILSDMIEGVSPTLLWGWVECFPMIPAYHWIAYQFFGKDPDFRKLRTWGWYALFVAIFMAFYPPLWGYALSSVFSAEDAYYKITPALFFTLVFTWILAPFLMLGALPLARKFGLYWAEIPGRVRERRLRSKTWIWESGRGALLAGTAHANPGLPIRMLVAGPFIALVLIMVGLVAFLSLRSGATSATLLAERLQGEAANNLRMQVDDALAAPGFDAKARATSLGELLRETDIAGTGRAFIVDREGRVIASSETAKSSRSAPVVETALRHLRGLPGGITGTQAPRSFRFAISGMEPFGGETWLGRVTPYRSQGHDPGWWLVTALPESDFLGTIQEGNSRAAMVFTVALIVTVLLAAFLATLVTKPLRDISNSARAMAQGDLTQRVPDSRLEELETLSDAFNHMAERLQQSFAEIRAGEGKLQSLLSISPLPISWMNDRGVIEFWNPKALDLFGYAPEEISTAEQWFERAYPDPEYRRTVIERWNAAGATGPDGEINRGEYDITCKDGRVVTAEIVGARCGDLTLVIFNDITERKHAAEELRRSEARFRLFSDISPLAVAVTDNQHQGMEYVNPRFIELFGYTLEDLPDTAHWWIHAYPDPVYRQQIEGEWMRQVMPAILNNTRMEEAFETQVTCKDGSRKTIQWDFASVAGKSIAFGLDVTSRKQAEEELRRAEAGFRMISDASPLAIATTDGPHQIIEYVNPTFLELFGYAREEIPDVAHWWALAYPDPVYSQQVTDAWTHQVTQATLDSTHIQKPVEAEVTCKDGSRKTILWGFVSASGKNIVFGMDLTARKQAERELRLVSDRLQVATQAAGIGVWDWDVVNNEVLWDDAMYRLYGIRREDFIGAYEAWRKVLHPEDAAQMEEAIQATLRGEREYNEEFRILRPDGSLRHIQAFGRTSRDAEGRPLRMVGVNYDITERKLTEEELRRHRDHLEEIVAARTAESVRVQEELKQAKLAADAANERLSVAIEGGDLATWQYVMATGELSGSNRNFAMFGAPKNAPVSLKAFFNLIHPDDRQLVENAAEEARRTGRMMVEYRVNWPDGSVRWLATRGRIFYDTDARPLHASGTTQDITRLVQAQEDLKKAKAAADTANAAKSQFLANMSHEIRTPMNAILGMSHLALKDSTDPHQRSYLEKIQRAGRHLLSVINDILDISKVEAGKLTIERSHFALSKLVDDVASVIADQAQEKGLRIGFDVAPDVPAELIGDRLRLGQVLINYATNAVKFTEQGEVRVTISVDERDGQDMVLRFLVHDTGIGLSREQLGLIFEAFQQGDSSTTRRYGGTGLGLTISKTLVHLMGGEVGVDSEQGKGSTFWFTARVGIGQLQPRAEELAPDIRRQRILVAEAGDELSRLLTAMGFTVASSRDGKEVVTAYRTSVELGRPFDVVLLDLDVARLNGPSVLEKIRTLARPRTPHVIAVASSGRANAIEQARRVGIEPLLKPIGSSDLFDKLIRIIGWNGGISAQSPEGYAPLEGKRVLLAEDNDFNQEVAQAILSDAGLLVDIASDGAAAVRMAQASRYDIILMDMQMPVMDGLVATREIRRLLPQRRIPIVAMTANVMQEDRQRCIEAGMDDFVSKPIEPDELLAVLVRWIEARDGSLQSGAPGSALTT